MKLKIIALSAVVTLSSLSLQAEENNSLDILSSVSPSSVQSMSKDESANTRGTYLICSSFDKRGCWYHYSRVYGGPGWDYSFISPWGGKITNFGKYVGRYNGYYVSR